MPKSVTHPPRLDPLRLPTLDEGNAALLTPGSRVEGLRFARADLDGRMLAGTIFSECSFEDASAHGTDLSSAAFIETAFSRLNSPVLSAPRSRFRDVTVDGSRIGAAELYNAGWQSVHFSHCKLGFINLRGAKLRDVLFTDCTIEELDLGGADALRVAFADCSADKLDLTGARLEHVDLRGLQLRAIAGIAELRGATLDPYQVTELAPLLAAHLGITIED